MTAILGLNAYHGDAAAALVVDGELVAAAEEERFNRIKHVAGFPTLAARVVPGRGRPDAGRARPRRGSRDPRANVGQKLLRTHPHGAERPLSEGRASRTRRRVRDVQAALADALGIAGDACAAARPQRRAPPGAPRERVLRVAVLRRGGALGRRFGDFVSTMWARGNGSLEVLAAGELPALARHLLYRGHAVARFPASTATRAR